MSMSHSNLHVIVGLGVTGLSCARYLKNQGVPVAITDTRLYPPNLDELLQYYPDIPLVLGRLDAALLAEASHIIISPGIALSEPLIAEQIARKVTVLGDIELFARAVNVPVIAITGTNAKSTVTTLVGKMAQAAGYKVQVGGNLGIPALDLLMQHPDTNLFVLELSSFQLETTYSLQPHVAAILNITPDHMDRYHNLEEYCQAKHRVYQHCHTAIANSDDQLTTMNNADVKKQFYFTLNEPKQHEFGLIKKEGVTYLAYENELLLPAHELPIPGKHYQANALAALAIGYGFGLPFAPMLKILREFKGLPHRCQLVRKRNEVAWYNDSKGTNVGATQAALIGLGSEINGKLILIAGGVGKNADFSPLIPVIQKYVRHVVLIGEAAPIFTALLADRVPFSLAQNMDEAVQQADTHAKARDSVLLSPACASFDMFKNYEHRGEIFTECVEKLM